MSKPIMCVDFDGVIHSYTSGWKGASVISDDPVPGAFDFLYKAVIAFDVRIYSSRSKDAFGVDAMRQWFFRHGFDKSVLNQEIKFDREKPAAFLTIDDRAFLFEGTFPDPLELLKFKPWNKRGED